MKLATGATSAAKAVYGIRIKKIAMATDARAIILCFLFVFIVPHSILPYILNEVNEILKITVRILAYKRVYP
jgi:hypothetical protein